MKYGVRRPSAFHMCHLKLKFPIQVRALPTVIAFKDGEPVAKFVGAIPEPKVAEFLKSV
jgi:thioredoxin-like negative regulator of GroEL